EKSADYRHAPAVWSGFGRAAGVKKPAHRGVAGSGRRRGTEKVEKILKKLELKIIHATPEEHDRQMASSQALVHFLGRGLAEMRLTKQKISTPDFQSLLKINDLVGNDTWQLFMDMQRFNPFAGEVRKNLVEALRGIEENIGRVTCNL
ncbi:MAG: hypothetical protein WC862_05785, partial [Patescibacteria group bacterium]